MKTSVGSNIFMMLKLNCNEIIDLYIILLDIEKINIKNYIN